MACGGEEGAGGGGVVVRGAMGRGRNEGGFGSYRRRPLEARISRVPWPQWTGLACRATAGGQADWPERCSVGGIRDDRRFGGVCVMCLGLWKDGAAGPKLGWQKAREGCYPNWAGRFSFTHQLAGQAQRRKDQHKALRWAASQWKRKFSSSPPLGPTHLFRFGNRH